MSLGDAYKPLRVLVLDNLREQIISGQLAPNARLVEDHLARELGVSRNPVREALRVLETEGLVDMNQRRGAVVSTLSPSDVDQVFEVREGLESLAARLAARKASPADAEALYADLARAEEALKKKDAATLTELNSRFHKSICVLAQNRYLAEMMDVVGGRVERIYRQNAIVRAPGSILEHGDIIKAIIDGDEDRAEAFAAKHVQNAARTIHEKLRERPGRAANEAEKDQGPSV